MKTKTNIKNIKIHKGVCKLFYVTVNFKYKFWIFEIKLQTPFSRFRPDNLCSFIDEKKGRKRGKHKPSMYSTTSVRLRLQLTPSGHWSNWMYDNFVFIFSSLSLSVSLSLSSWHLSKGIGKIAKQIVNSNAS